MSQHQAFLDRMTGRLGELENRIASLRSGAQDPAVRELEVGLASLKERLQAMRRAGSDLGEDQTLSFAQGFERLNAAVGRAQTAHSGGPSVA